MALGRGILMKNNDNVDIDWADNLVDRKPTSDLYIFIRGNLMT
jgi:hypothetical protein